MTELVFNESTKGYTVAEFKDDSCTENIYLHQHLPGLTPSNEAYVPGQWMCLWIVRQEIFLTLQLGNAAVQFEEEQTVTTACLTRIREQQ